jgi:hypothetical protein
MLLVKFTPAASLEKLSGFIYPRTFTGGYSLLAPCCPAGTIECSWPFVQSCCPTGSVCTAFGDACCPDCRSPSPKSYPNTYGARLTFPILARDCTETINAAQKCADPSWSLFSFAFPAEGICCLPGWTGVQSTTPGVSTCQPPTNDDSNICSSSSQAAITPASSEAISGSPTATIVATVVPSFESSAINSPQPSDLSGIASVATPQSTSQLNGAAASFATDSPSPSTSSVSPKPTSSPQRASGTVAGATVGAAGGLAVLAAGIFFCYRSRQRKAGGDSIT